jgi:2'-5' RNA ligase
MMFAIASILSAFPREKTKSLWTALELQCGLVGIQVAPLPHFSWQVAEYFEKEKVYQILSNFSRSITPFIVKTAGLGIFTGLDPVMYLPIVKSQKIFEIHAWLWEYLSPYANGVNPYYEVSEWIPHITLASNDATPQNLACAVADLSSMDLQFEILVNNFALIYKIGEESGIERQFGFGSVEN